MIGKHSEINFLEETLRIGTRIYNTVSNYEVTCRLIFVQKRNNTVMIDMNLNFYSNISLSRYFEAENQEEAGGGIAGSGT